MVISDTHDDHDAIRGVMTISENVQSGPDHPSRRLLRRRRHPGAGRLSPHPGPGYVGHRLLPGLRREQSEFIEIAGWRIFLTHTPDSHYNDPSTISDRSPLSERKGTDVFLFGHTHIAEIRRRNGTVCINPGHMSSDESRGCPLTFALLEIDSRADDGGHLPASRSPPADPEEIQEIRPEINDPTARCPVVPPQ